jgi:hypothetical protein
MRGSLRWRILFALALVGLVIVALVYSPAPDPSKTRGPNANETFYQYIAFELDAGAMPKLSPTAILPGGGLLCQTRAPL